MGYRDPPKQYQFKPGQSGNPKGRPKRPDIASLDKLIAECGTERKIAETWIDRAVGNEGKGIEADFQWFKLLIEHRNGSPPKEQADEADAQAEAKPRIIIPGSTGTEGRPKAARGPRKRKPPA